MLEWLKNKGKLWSPWSTRQNSTQVIVLDADDEIVLPFGTWSVDIYNEGGDTVQMSVNGGGTITLNVGNGASRVRTLPGTVFVQRQDTLEFIFQGLGLRKVVLHVHRIKQYGT